MKTQNWFYAGLSVILLFSFSSCATLPKPPSENSTLLIIPIKSIKKTTNDYYRHYMIELTNTDTTIKIEPKTGYLFIRNLKPGEYVATKLISLHRKHIRRREFPLHIPFSLYPKTITIFPSRLEILLRNELGRSFTLYQYWEFFELSTDEKQAIVEDIKTYQRIEYWKIQED
jgi:hypothetical protein